MVEISAIVMLVVGVLQFILFFKLWGVTNDVKKLKDRFKAHSVEDDIRTAYLNGQKEIAQEMVNKHCTNCYNELKTIGGSWDKISLAKKMKSIKGIAEKYNLSLPIFEE